MAGIVVVAVVVVIVDSVACCSGVLRFFIVGDWLLMVSCSCVFVVSVSLFAVCWLIVAGCLVVVVVCW